MRSTMMYMVALEDGEIVKMTYQGWESTGMFFIPVGEAPSPHITVRKAAQVTVNA